MPEQIVVCTDYTENAIEHLKNVFTNVDKAYTFDMLFGDYTKLDNNALFIMFRVSTEFNINQWYEIFEKMYDAKIEYIVFIPAGIDNIKSIASERIRHLINVLRGKKDIFCGWLYSENEYKKMFRNNSKQAMYIVEERIILKNTVLYLLKKNQN